MNVNYDAIMEHTLTNPMWGNVNDATLYHLDAYHAQRHDDGSIAVWMAGVNGMYESMCGLSVDMLVAVRRSGGTRN